MATFTERKAARIADAQKQYEFVVVAGFPFDGEILGRFASKKAASEFASKSRGGVIGNTAAHDAIFAKHRNEHVPTSMNFLIHKSEKLA
jgi:hypothetical protein